MTRRRWIADEARGDTAAVTGTNAHHLARVLRAKAGQEFDIAVEGTVRRGVIVSMNEERVEFTLHEETEAAEQLPLTLLLAIFKFDRMEWAIEKATELGVAAIVPAIARRTDAHLAAACTKRVERWRKIAKEASQQSRRTNPPHISEPTKLKSAIEALSKVPLRIVCAENEEERQFAPLLKATTETCVAVGPEGGWVDEELKLFEASGWQSASLGATILRAETAAIAALAIAAAFPQK